MKREKRAKYLKKVYSDEEASDREDGELSDDDSVIEVSSSASSTPKHENDDVDIEGLPR